MSSIIKCKQYDMLQIKFKRGQIYYCTDTNNLYKDYGDSNVNRIRINAKVLTSEYERLEKIIPTFNKMYYVIDTNNLYLYNGKWTFISGDTQEYNTYAYYESTGTLSPVKNIDEYITSKTTGDVIIDNNGLLGNGSVVIRDSNRIAKGLLEVDDINNRLNIKSYLGNGINLIPYSNKNYNDFGMKTGTLQLNMIENGNSFIGNAEYNGDWYNYGNQYVVKRNVNNNNIFPEILDDSIINKTFINFYYNYITKDKHNLNSSEIKEYKCYLTLNLKSLEYNYKTQKYIPNIFLNVLVIDKDDESSVIVDDRNSPIFTKATVNMQYDLGVENINVDFEKNVYNDLFDDTNDIISEFKDYNCIEPSNHLGDIGIINTLKIKNIPIYNTKDKEKYVINGDGTITNMLTQDISIDLNITEKHIINDNNELQYTNLNYEINFNSIFENGDNNEYLLSIELNTNEPSNIEIKNWIKSKVLTIDDAENIFSELKESWFNEIINYIDSINIRDNN